MAVIGSVTGSHPGRRLCRQRSSARPMILVYKTTPVTYRLARWLIRVKWIGLVNLVAGRSVVPELIQHDATAERLIREARRLLNDRQRMIT